MTRSTELAAWVGMRAGVVHTSDARAAGFGKADAADAVARGLLRRVRRSWLVTPGADARIVAAVAVGGRATCVTEAARLGVWTPGADGVHVAVPATSSRLDASGLRLHWGAGPAPVERSAAVDPLINVLFHVARCVPRADAACVWESALNRGMITAPALQGIEWGSTRARELASCASALSDSGLETICADGLRRLGLRFGQQVWVGGHRVDFLIGDRLVVQLDGFAHHQAAARRRDLRHDAALVLQGYTVLRFDYYQVLFAWEEVRDAIVGAVARGLHRAKAR